MAFQRDTPPTGNKTEYHKFVQADVEENHNKYWNVGLYDSGDVEIHFGRIGVTITQGIEPNAGKMWMEKRIQEKLRGKTKNGKREYYRKIQTIDSTSSAKSLNKNTLKQIAKEQIKHTSPETSKLIEWLAEVNRHQITSATGKQITYDADTGLFKTPMGIITPDSIVEARKLLVDIGDFIAKQDFEDYSLKSKVNDYLMLVPTNVGMKLNVRSFLPDLPAVQKQGQILDALDASYIDITTSKNTGDKDEVKKEKVFETKLDVLEDGKEWDRINKYYSSSRNNQHYGVYGMKIKQIWVVEIPASKEKFEIKASKLGNVNELFHGTQYSNVLSIMKVGLVIPPASSPYVTGRLYSDGIYASSQSTKALNYATSFWGGQDIGRYFMFLLDMAMGKPFIPNKSRWGSVSGKYPVAGYDSTWAKPGCGVINDERIVYNVDQVNLKYLIEFKR